MLTQKTILSLYELIKALDNAANFYEMLSLRTQTEEVKELYTEFNNAKRAAAQALSNQLETVSCKKLLYTDADYYITNNELYVFILKSFSSDNIALFINDIATTENNIFEAIRNIHINTNSQKLRATLIRIVSKEKNLQQQLKDMKRITA